MPILAKINGLDLVYLLTLMRTFTPFLFFLFFGFTSVGYSAPQDVENYTILNGGLVDIQEGAYVEGSLRTNGTQPDYYLDFNSEPLKSMLGKAQEIGRSPLSFWDKVDSVVKLVRHGLFKYRHYDDPRYLNLLEKYRTLNRDIPLSEYGACQAGVCREHALALHFALKSAGIENLHGYAKIFRASKYMNYEITEDHAFTVVKHKNISWVVDAYYWAFNGFRLVDLMSPQGITPHSLRSPIANPGPETRRIIEINEFPKIYNPKRARCTSFFAQVP